MIRQSKFLVLAAVAAAALLTGACTTTTNRGTGSMASDRQGIDANVDAAMTKLYTQVPSARELVGRSRGVLVFPSVLSAGFVVGGSYGKGALVERSRTTGYYSTAAASVGLIAGADSRAVYVLFMTQEALDRFKASKGWTAGVDASVTVVTVGANGSIDTQTAQAPVIGFVLSNAGLMANLSLEGTKFTRLDM